MYAFYCQHMLGVVTFVLSGYNFKELNKNIKSKINHAKI